VTASTDTAGAKRRLRTMNTVACTIDRHLLGKSRAGFAAAAGPRRAFFSLARTALATSRSPRKWVL